MARFAEREAVESDGHARPTWRMRELRQPSVPQRAGGRRAAAEVDCLLVAI